MLYFKISTDWVITTLLYSTGFTWVLLGITQILGYYSFVSNSNVTWERFKIISKIHWYYFPYSNIHFLIILGYYDHSCQSTTLFTSFIGVVSNTNNTHTCALWFRGKYNSVGNCLWNKWVIFREHALKNFYMGVTMVIMHFVHIQ